MTQRQTDRSKTLYPHNFDAWGIKSRITEYLRLETGLLSFLVVGADPDGDSVLENELENFLFRLLSAEI
jgi:hypothetical protein